MSFNEWKEVKLSEIVVGNKGNYGIGAPAVDYDTNLYTYLRITDITDDGRLNKEGLKSVADEDAKNYLLSENDIVFARTGNSTGRSYFYEPSDGELVYAGFLIKFKLDENKVNPRYIKLYTMTSDYKNWIESISTGSTRKNINAKMYGDMDIKLPSREVQDYIVNLIEPLNKKIEVNNKINKRLEDMAQAIFKYWFVDFEFPNEEGKPYKSSGGEMVESELGMIPKGWEVGVFRNYITNILGGDWGKEQSQGNYTKDVYCVRGADIPEINKGNKGKSPVRFILEKNFNNKKLTEGDLIVEISGGSPTQSTGRIAYINKSVLDKFDKGLVCTNFCRAITLKDRNLMEFVYIYWTYLYDLDVFFQFENGTTGIKNLDINNFLDKNSIINPPKEIIERFYKIVNDLFIIIQKNGKENEKLSNLRDTLLPKLMSGEIRVPIK